MLSLQQATHLVSAVGWSAGKNIPELKRNDLSFVNCARNMCNRYGIQHSWCNGSSSYPVKHGSLVCWWSVDWLPL